MESKSTESGEVVLPSGLGDRASGEIVGSKPPCRVCWRACVGCSDAFESNNLRNIDDIVDGESRSVDGSLFSGIIGWGKPAPETFN